MRVRDPDSLAQGKLPQIIWDAIVESSTGQDEEEEWNRERRRRK